MPAPAFVNRELNGEVLLEELGELRSAQVHQRQLVDCASALRELVGLRHSEARERLKQLATARFAQQPALAALLVRWSNHLKSDADVAPLAAHFERLARVGAALHALRRASDRLPMGGRG